MIGSEEETSASKWLKLVPDLSTLFTLEDINMVKPGKIIIKGYAVSGSGRRIERLEVSLDRWKSWLEASRNPKTGNQDNKSACMSFEATIDIDDDVSQTMDVIAREIKVRAIVINKAAPSEELVPELIRSVLERLNFAEFHTARSISWDWYSNAELCPRENPTPWLILFSNKNLETNVACTLFDPQGKRTYLVRDLGLDFHKTRCLANSGSWFLFLDHRTNFYLLNLFTRERIRLPSLEAIDGWQMRLERVSDSDFFVVFYYEATGNFSSGKVRGIRIGNAVLWVDERSRDYLVVWNLDCFFAYSKRGVDDGNKSWKVFQPLKNQGCVDMVYKESKLYVLSLSKEITVYDFSGGDHPPKECASFPPPDHHHKHHFTNLAVTLSGEVLTIAERLTPWEIFNVYRMDPRSNKWVKIHSIGNDEALLLDQGTTVAAQAKVGIAKNCIYFSNDQIHRYNRTALSYETTVCVYNIQTKKIVQSFQHLAASSPKSFEDGRWFFPTFGGKWFH